MTQSEKYTKWILPALSAFGGDEHTGSGITHYTRKSPQHYRKRKRYSGGGLHHNIIEFFPANKKALLHRLVYLLGEYRSGNTAALRNEIVPIIHYLESIGVPIPESRKRIKNTNNNLNWLYD